jgi:diguanylate cyclase (GGDEF)-like protein/PAS domain S-box-containing protein
VVNRHLLLRTFLGYLLPFVALLTAGFGVFLAVDYQHHKELVAVNEGVQIELARKSLVRDFEQILPDINVLVNERHVQRFATRGDETSRGLVIEELQSFALHKRLFRTIRYLDRSGKELVRIDYRDGSVEVISRAELQNKADSYYFKDSLGLARGELYISPIDLNVEHGRIEIPYVPTIRFAMPVYDGTGVKQGVLVLNYMAERMLRRFDEMLTRSAGHVALLNAQGYWIRAHDDGREWGFMFKRDQTLAKAHPVAWQRIKSDDKGQMINTDGMFTYTTIYPLKIIGGYSAHEVENEHIGHHHIDPDSYYWKIVSNVPMSVFNGNLEKNLLGAPGIIWLILMVLGSVACWRSAINHIERRNLRSEVELHAKLYENTTDGVLIVDPDIKIVATNEAFTAITGYSQEEVLGKNPRILSSGKHDKEFYEELWATLARDGSWEGEVVNRRKDGGIYIEWLRISAIKDQHKKVTNYVAIFSDITNRKLSEEELHRRAHHDPLTGLSNRLSFDERLDQNLVHARRNRSKLALLYIDLDKFKPINDTYSHQAGDAVLREIAERLRSEVREMDTVARIGGDEFVVILGEIDTVEHAGMVAEHIRERLREPIEYQGNALKVGASIGIAVFPDHGVDSQQLMAEADAAMYRAKHQPPCSETSPVMPLVQSAQQSKAAQG